MNYKRLRVYWRKAKWPLALLCMLSLLLWWYVEVIRDWNRFSIRQVYPEVSPSQDHPDRYLAHGFQSLYFLVEGTGDPYVRLKYVQAFALSYRDFWAPLLMEKRIDGRRAMIYFMPEDEFYRTSGNSFYDYFDVEYICIYNEEGYRAPLSHNSCRLHRTTPTPSTQGR